MLKLCYKFRFISVPLLADYLARDKSSVYENLYVLEKQGYIAKRYDKTYKLRGRPASYCLIAKGIKFLKTQPETKQLVNETVLRNMYKNRTISEEHVDHCLQVLASYVALNSQTNKTFNIFSKSELATSSFFPRPLPDLYLSRKQLTANKQSDYMLDVFDATIPFFVYIKRLRAYQNHCDEAELDDGESYPYVLLIAPDDKTEQRLLKLIEGMLQDFDIYTTTLNRILAPPNNNSAIWKDVFADDEYIEL